MPDHRSAKESAQIRNRHQQVILTNFVDKARDRREHATDKTERSFWRRWEKFGANLLRLMKLDEAKSRKTGERYGGLVVGIILIVIAMALAIFFVSHGVTNESQIAPFAAHFVGPTLGQYIPIVSLVLGFGGVGGVVLIWNPAIRIGKRIGGEVGKWIWGNRLGPNKTPNLPKL